MTRTTLREIWRIEVVIYNDTIPGDPDEVTGNRSGANRDPAEPDGGEIA
jgi:hypothetical protein